MKSLALVFAFLSAFLAAIDIMRGNYGWAAIQIFCVAINFASYVRASRGNAVR